MSLLHLKETREFFGFLLEDAHRDIKVKGITRIPAGFYPLKIRKIESELTLKHRKAYGDWFKFHIEITGIPNFQFCYLHAGNDPEDTEGCVLPGDTLTNHHTVSNNPLAKSIQALKRFYDYVYPHLETGGNAFLEIRDEETLFK
jgi:hypothetical protein